MNYLSVCSGIEAATVAWHHMGWKPVGFSEIEKFPSQVLAHHYPQVTNFGDMTKYKEWQINDPVGLLVGGTPCQSFSVAGLRKGLADPRGNLALTYVGILDHFRPKWFVWENVPGVLSSNKGRDFAAFLTALGIIGYGWSYRVLDAQYFGVAQRRRRVFVVGCLRGWRPTAEVLFESESLRRDNKKSRTKREESSTYIERGIAYGGSDPNISDTVTSKWHKGSGGPAGNECGLFVAHKIYENHPSDSRVKEMGDVCQTVTSSWGGGGGNIPFVQNIAYEWHNQDSRIKPINVAATLNCNAGGREGHLIQNVPIALQGAGATSQNGNGSGYSENIMYTLNKTDVHGVAIPYDLYQITSPLNGQRRQNGDPCHTLARDNAAHASVTNGSLVRRLTPIECERLQGFPDGYTNIKPKGKETPDGNRYKALGNSMAVPVMRWIGERINRQELGSVES